MLNRFVVSHGIQSVLEFGCGDGNQLSLATYPSYTGLDVSQTAVDMCRKLFANDPTKSFKLLSAYDGQPAELSLSLDVIYHLVEDTVFDAYIKALFDSATRFVAIYATNLDRESGSKSAHVRHRRFTDIVAARRPDFEFLTEVPNAFPPGAPGGDTSPANFYFYARS